MKTCHVCSAECEDNMELCPLCGAELKGEAETKINTEEKSAESDANIMVHPTLLTSFEDIISAEIFKDILKDNQIPFACSSDMGDNSIQVLFGGGFIAEDIYVEEKDLEKAIQLLEDFNSQEIEFEEDFFENEDTDYFKEEN